LPAGFEWDTFDVTDDAVVKEICEFLMDHYVEDEDGNFRLLYTPEKFRWAIMCPGWIKDLHVIVRNSKNRKIMASITGVPKKYILNNRNVKMNEVNFLAVHKKLRSKRFAQIMI